MHLPQQVDQATVQQLLDRMWMSRTMPLLEQLQHVTQDIVYYHYPRPIVRAWFFADSPTTATPTFDARWLGGFFWAVQRTLCMTLPHPLRRAASDGDVDPYTTLIPLVTHFPFPVAFDTWLYTCGVWLTTCNIEAFSSTTGVWGAAQIAETGAAIAMINWADSQNF